MLLTTMPASLPGLVVVRDAVSALLVRTGEVVLISTVAMPGSVRMVVAL